MVQTQQRALLAEKTIIVIGGTAGIGFSAVRAFIAAGAKVVALGLNPEKILAIEQELGSSARVLSSNAIHPDTADKAIAEAVATFGRCDGLYHVAGGSGRRIGDGPLHEITDEGWRATLELNLNSLFYSNRAAVRHFLASGTAGSILNMTSVLGFAPSPRFFATHAYAAAKSAVIGFTKSCAAYYAAQGIRFNALAPGLVDTPMARRAATDSQIQAFIKTKQPLEEGRIGQPQDLDAAAVYFMSDGSRFTTGQILSVDGGWSVSEGQLPPQ